MKGNRRKKGTLVVKVCINKHVSYYLAGTFNSYEEGVRTFRIFYQTLREVYAEKGRSFPLTVRPVDYLNNTKGPVMDPERVKQEIRNEVSLHGFAEPNQIEALFATS